MKQTLVHISVLLFIVSSNLFGQSDTITIQDVDMNRVWKERNDSLREAFYNEPNSLTIYFEKNGKPLNLKSYELYLLIDGEKKEFSNDDSNKFIVDFPLDTSENIEMIFKTQKLNFNFQLDRPSLIENGASIHFGVMNDIRKVVRQDTLKKSFEDWNLNEVEWNYRQLLENEDLNQAIKDGRISRITYAIVIPRVFGCGTLTTYQRFE